MLRDYHKLHYVSFNVGEAKLQEFGEARLRGYLLDLWQSGQLTLTGVPYETTAPSLTEAELASIPGATIAMGNLDKLTLCACIRAGDKINIKEDSRREWTSVDDKRHEAFKDISKNTTLTTAKPWQTS